MTWAALLLLAPAAPLLLALGAFAPGVRRRLPATLPLAPLPALAAALLVPPGTVAPLPDLLLGAALTLSESGRVFLGVAALLWCLAAVYARGYMGAERTGTFCGFWLATLAGNLGIFLAADAISFYLAFSLVSLAAFGLIVHAGTVEARRAARIYLVLAVAGEAALLAGLQMGATAAQSLMIVDIRDVLGRAPTGGPALLLIVAGLALKAGLMPLHVWLPLAHPAAPTPASAVLSGAIVKAGIFGLLQFLPLGADMPGWALGLAAVGLTTTYLGLLFGIVQSRPKTVLAYSTVSQMGLLVTVLASAMTGADVSRAVASVTLYAAHHAFAKGALFLAIGLAPRVRGAMRVAVLTATGLAALAIAGLPLSGGALAKLAIKGPLEGVPTGLLVTLSAVGTTALMLRAMRLIGTARPVAAAPAAGMFLAFGAAVAASALIAWFLFPSVAGESRAYAAAPGNLWAAAWPVLAGAGLWLAARRTGVGGVTVPEGDLGVLGERLASSVVRAVRVVAASPRPPAPRVRTAAVDRRLLRLERALRAWPLAASAFLLATIAGFVLLAWR